MRDIAKEAVETSQIVKQTVGTMSDSFGAASKEADKLVSGVAMNTERLQKMKNVLNAQENVLAAQNQRVDLQIQKVEKLDARYNKLLATKGSEASQTINANIALSKALAMQEKLTLKAHDTVEAIAMQKIEIQDFTSKMSSASKEIEDMVDSQQKYTKEIKQSSTVATRLLTTVKSVAATLGAVTLVKSFLQTSDTLSQISSKINRINDDKQTDEQLQEMIYAAAQRSRGVYSDTANMITKLGQNAKEVFNSNAELVQFAENLNKSFVNAGATQQEMSSATMQLTQALGSGVLRGEELNAVFESAPNIIQNIAEYLGAGTGEIRDMAAEGKITADVVKNAMLSATDEINAAFEDMPMTLAQAFTMGKNDGSPN